jgi:hypothetical protein
MHTETNDMNRQEIQAYVRPSRIEVEPILSAAGLVALVLAVNAWWAPPVAQEAVPASQTVTTITASASTH